METFFVNYFLMHQTLGYALVLLLLTIESQTVLFAAAFLVRLGVFKIYWIIAIALLGVIGTDYFWYFIGRHFHGRSSFFRRWSEKLGKPMDIHLEQRPNHTLAVAKFTFGLHTPVMLRAGSLKMPIKKFIKGDVLSSFLWITIVFSLGYGSGATLTLLKHYFRYAEIGLAVALIIFVLTMYFVGRRLRKEI